MKQIALDKLYLTPKLLMTALVILTLSIFSIIATAAETDSADAGGKSLGERFNHMATGFPLTGLHATAECGSCHVSGIFKGTAKNCSGCHTKGQRVVATAMSSKHLVTTDPCETCHTNTVTFYGARYNHGKAVPGQCATCHNGFNATGRAVSHTSGSKLTKSCDSCHRTFAWLPASWNHFGNTAKCVTCHVTGGEGSAFVRTPLAGTSKEGFAHRYTAAADCESCHSNYFSWAGAIYDHAAAGTACSSCHNGTTATGTAQSPHGNLAALGATECSECHTTTRTWLGALGAKPTNHIPYNAGTACTACHIGSTVTTGASLHANVTSYTCNNCHQKGAQICTGTCLGNIQTSSHKGSTTCNSGGCHSSYTTWNK